jgi:penicillin-binding protein 1C
LLTRRGKIVALLIASIGLVVALVPISIVTLSPPSLTRFEDRSQVVVDQKGKILRAYLARDGRWRILTTENDIPKLYLKLLVEMEDKRFFKHVGVDPLAVLRAAGQLLMQRRIVSGASTITMQVVRLLEPGERSLKGKLRQVIGAVQLERRFSKSEILTLYLTLAPFGGNIEGVRAASLAYFGKEPFRLSEAETAFLIALPQSPEGRRPDLFPHALREARDRVLQRGVTARMIAADRAKRAQHQPVTRERRTLIGSAPHASDALRRRYPDREVVTSLLDADLQRKVSAIFANSDVIRRHRVSAAALVVRNSDLAIRAYVSGPGFFDSERAGQVDLVRAVRSPGSALKPFVYGLAFERLLLHPLSIVTDHPLRFGNYEPRNFTGDYRGEMTARESLIGSINTTAVSILAKLGPENLTARLRTVGARLAVEDTDRQTGLAIALGGCGISMLDLTLLYAALANQGNAHPLRLAPSDPVTPSTRLMNADAAWAISNILADMPAPEGFARGPRRIAYKTGTSYSFRDAWAVGYDRLHTAAIWVGRPDGAPNLGTIGRSAAAPLLYQLFDLLPKPEDDVAGAPPGHSILARRTSLPDRLQRFDGSESSSIHRPLRISFPYDGAQIKLSSENANLQSLPLAANGGNPPLYWYVDGQQVSSATHEREFRWRPDGAGQVNLRVIDSNGSVASIRFWIE